MAFSTPGTISQEAAVCSGRAEAHDALDAGAVVPTAVEDHDLARRRQVGDVALDVHLGLLALGRGRQGDDAEDARADPPVMALIVPPLPAASRPSKTTQTFGPVCLDPLLERDQLDVAAA